MRSFIIILFLIFASFASKSDEITLGHYATNQFGQVLFVRHALAPGYGDPAYFKFDDCETQRNLNSEGQLQAASLGKLLKKNRVSFLKVYSSQWCRCIDTARLMNVGHVIPFSGLNSFYQGIVPKKETLFKLRYFLNTLKDVKKPILLVTHYVTIEAITGVSVASGGVVAYDVITGKSKRVLF